MTCGDIAWLSLDRPSKVLDEYKREVQRMPLVSDASVESQVKCKLEALAMDDLPKASTATSMISDVPTEGEALQLEKVRWIDDSSESDWIAATELSKQVLMPLEVAIGWKAPVEVLRHLPNGNTMAYTLRAAIG